VPLTPDIAATEAAIVEMTNAFRAEQKLPPVRSNPKLVAAARAYARKLGAYSGLSHTADGTTPSERIAAAGYRYCQVGENLASILDTRGFDAQDYAKRAVEGWEESPGHRKNMMLPYVTEIGVAVAPTASTEPTYIAVQLFGRPESTKYTFKITNLSGREVAYAFEEQGNTVSPREIITHAACLPGTIEFDTGAPKGVVARYETRGGQVFTVKPGAGGAVTVEVKEAPVPPAPSLPARK
jgi:cysteine-rich secretory family protein